MTRYGVKPFLGAPWPIPFQRAWLELVSRVNRASDDAETEWRTAEGLTTMVARPRGTTPETAVLYLHGGAYCVGSPSTHRGLITHLAVAAHAAVYAPDYRLAPESPHPAALEDALLCYERMIDHGHDPSRIALAGDSAGGGLALATAIAIRDEGLISPAAIVLISPWVDLTCRSKSRTEKERIDPTIRNSWSLDCARRYAGGRPLDDPACSPLFASHRGLPPVLIQVGSDEVVLDDSLDLAERCRAARVDVTLEVYEGMWHIFQTSVGVMAKSDEAVGEIVDFLRAQWH